MVIPFVFNYWISLLGMLSKIELALCARLGVAGLGNPKYPKRSVTKILLSINNLGINPVKIVNAKRDD